MPVDVLEVTQVVLFARAHFRFFLGAVHMVVAAEVEYAVGEQVRDLRIEGVSRFSGLTDGGWKGDGDIAQERLIGRSLDEVVGFIGEGKDVGRFIDAQELMVELAHFVVAGHEDGERGPGADVSGGHDTGSEAMERLAIERRCLNGYFDGDVVGDFVVHR